MKKLLAIVLGVALAGVGTVALASRNASGTYNLPAGNPVVGGTKITSSWANTTLGDLAQSITDSLDRNGKGGMLAPLRVPNGSAGAPGHSFTNDTDTGLYLSAAGDARISAGGVDSLQCTATGVTVPGTLGVTGAATVGGALGVTGAVTAAGVASSSGVTITDGALTLSKAAFQQIVKSGSGQIEIGTATGNDSTVDLLQNGVVRWRLNSTGDLVAVDGPHALQNVYDPVNAQDAATKAYVDARGSTAGKIVAGGIVDAAGSLYGGFGATAAKGATGVYTLTLSASYTAPTPVVGLMATGAAGVGFVSAQVTAGNQITVRTWTTAAVAADRDFSFYVVAGP
jgi:hypothetical protein